MASEPQGLFSPREPDGGDAWPDVGIFPRKEGVDPEFRQQVCLGERIPPPMLAQVAEQARVIDAQPRQRLRPE